MNCSNSYFIANKLDDKERQQAMFLSACSTNDVHWDLCQPAKAADYSLKILSCHFAAKLSVIVEHLVLLKSLMTGRSSPFACSQAEEANGTLQLWRGARQHARKRHSKLALVLIVIC